MRLKDKVALITGAGSGIGLQTVFLFAKEGAAIVAVDVNEQAAQGAAKQVKNAIAGAADGSSASDCERMVAEAEKKFGRLNVLFDNAGILHAKDDDAKNTNQDVGNHPEDIHATGVLVCCT